MSKRSFRSVIATAAVTVGLIMATAMPAHAEQVEDGTLQNTAKPTYLASVTFDWWDGTHQVFRDDVATAGVASYPSVGDTGPLVLDGFCISYNDDSDTTGFSVVIAEGDRSDCMIFAAVETTPGFFTFQVQDARASAGVADHYFGDGDSGGVLDLVSTTPIVIFMSPGDVNPPPAPTLTSPLDVTDASAPITGTAEAGSTVEILDENSTVVCTTTATIDGTFSCTPATPLDLGTNALTITATDDAGNRSEALAVTITVAAAEPQLAATGADIGGGVLGISLALLLMGTAAVVTSRRKSAPLM